MFVETYDDKGNSTGFELYEVGVIKEKTKDVLSVDSLDSNMGFALGIASYASGSDLATALSSSVIVGEVLSNVPIAAGVSMRRYASYDDMKNASENARYDTVLNFNTTKDNDIAIKNTAYLTGKNFGKYNLFTNNCTQHASNALASGGVVTTQFCIPNLATFYMKNCNSKDFMTIGWH